MFSSLAGDGTEFVLTDLARALASAKDRRTTGTTLEADPRFEVTLAKGPDFRAWTTDGVHASSFESLRVSVGATR